MIYKFCPPDEHSLQNLQKGQLYCRHYSDFNDPFEFWAKIVSGIPDASQASRLQEAYRTWGFPSVDINRPPEPCGDYFGSLECGQPRFPSLYDSWRISCFSSTADNLLMWAHYASGLRGFCFGLEEHALVEGSGAHLENVEYLEEPPLVDSFVFAVAEDQYEYHMMAMKELEHSAAVGDHDWRVAYRQSAEEALGLMRTIWRRAFAAKPFEWSYERERRLLVPADRGTDPVLHAYPAAALRVVITGERMCEGYRKSLEATVSKNFPGVPVKKATRSTENYRIEVS